MRALARRGVVRQHENFYKHIDTLVCVHPDLPRGSRVDSDKYVTVVGYGALLDRLVQPGPRPQWTDEEWEEFVLDLGVYRVDPQSAAERERRNKMDAVAQYASRFTAMRSADLHELVELRYDTGEGAHASRFLADEVTAGRTIALVGPSGAGKTHAAQHLAISLSSKDHLVVWVRCDEYRKGAFGELIARSMAPFSAERWNVLVQFAADVGRPVTLILDGLNECPPELRDELIEQTQAFRLRYPGGSLITSTVTLTCDGVAIVHTRLPDETEAAALLHSHGAPSDLRIGPAFSTPFELAIAAHCLQEMPANSSIPRLLDVYISSVARTEVTRSGLRHIASLMDDQFRSSLATSEVRAALLRGSISGSTAALDALLSCPLLDVTQGRVRFRHERFARFLAAEDVVLTATTGNELGECLKHPSRQDLRVDALALESDALRRAQAFERLADSALLESALLGELGEAARDQVVAAVENALAEAARDDQPYRLANVESFFSRWVAEVPLTAAQHALLTSAGAALRHGLFVDEIGRLLDRTDERCARQAASLRNNGGPQARSRTFAATYTQMGNRDLLVLPATVVVAACERAGMGRRASSTHPHAVASALLAGASDRSWGRLYCAALLLDPTQDADANALAELILRSWRAGPYHLRLEALQTARRSSYALVSNTRHDVIDALESLDPGSNWALSTVLVEALASFGRIQPMVSDEDVRSEIAAVLKGSADDELACAAAARIVSNMFEEDGIVGTFVPDNDRDEELLGVFRRYARPPDTSNSFPDEAVSCYVEALLGLVKLGAPPEFADDYVEPRARTWNLVASVFAQSQLNLSAPERARAWQALLGDLCSYAADVVYSLSWGTWFGERADAHDRFISANTEEIRTLAEWALTNPEDVDESWPIHDRTRRAEHYLKLLGRIGSATSVPVVRSYVSDQALGTSAVSTLRAIAEREPN